MNVKIKLETKFEDLTNELDNLPPVTETIEAKKKLAECAFWALSALDLYDNNFQGEASNVNK